MKFALVESNLDRKPEPDSAIRIGIANRSARVRQPAALSLFAALVKELQPRHSAEEEANRNDSDDDGPPRPTAPGANQNTARRGGRQALPLHLKRERVVHDLGDDKNSAASASKRCASSASRWPIVMNTPRPRSK